MRPIVWLTLLASLVFSPLAGCATCPDGRCASRKVVDECCDDGCSYCNSDGIMSNGFPCDHCGPQLANPFTGKPVRSYFRNMLTCAGGCGEVYWDEWHNDPPNRCDPCVNLGNCKRRGFLTNFWSTIVGGNCSDDCCLDECDHGIVNDDFEDYDATPRSRQKAVPLDPAPAPPTVSPEDTQPDQKAQRPRRVIRR